MIRFVLDDITSIRFYAFDMCFDIVPDSIGLLF